MYKRFLLSLLVAICLPLCGQAQGVKPGKLTVVQDSSITKVVNKRTVAKPVAATPATTTTNAPKPVASTSTPSSPQDVSTQATNDKKVADNAMPEKKDANTTTKAASKSSAAPTSTAAKTSTAAAPKVHVARQRYNADGFRIQVFTGGNSRADKSAAQNMQHKVRQAFPELSTYVNFQSPHWVCRVGDFISRADAQRYVQKIRAKRLSYELRIVKSKVFVAR